MAELERFPVDASGTPRFSRRFDLQEHPATDIFADAGTPVVAVTKGEARGTVDPKGGMVVYLKGDDGWSYYYAHLDSFEPGTWPRRVAAGDVLGTVGTTGTAEGKQPHLHFQMRPQDGSPVDPFDYLERAAGPIVPVVPEPSVRSRAPGNRRRRPMRPEPRPAGSMQALGWLFLLWMFTERRHA